jgi:cytochrome c peroxidase
VSNQSKYDKVQRAEASFTADEQEGYMLFKTHCATCHAEPLFTDFSFRNNGLDTIFKDEGRQRITLSSSDLGKFKVPSLRNVALSSPYMHDGRFDDLESVINHYTNGIKTSATLDAGLLTPIVLSPTQKTQLIAFLKTLSDNSFIADKRFSEPVK